jgi:NitT/TauT family transport system substrate-binding protein
MWRLLLVWLSPLFIAAVGAPVHAALPIQVGYTNTVSCAGLFIGVDQGLFARRGLDVHLTLIALNSTIPAALVGDSVQIGAATPSVMLQAVDGGLDLVVIAGGAVNDVHRVTGGALARPGLIIRTAKDFEGKRVGVPGLGAYMHVMFRRWLVQHGADDRKVNFVEVPLAQEGDILRSGNVDAVVSGEPYFNRIIQSGTGYLVAPFFTELPDGLSMIYFTSTRQWARAHPAAVEAFAAALEEARAFLIAQPAKARAIIGEYTRLPPAVLPTLVMPTIRVQVPASDLTYWTDMLLAQGLIRKRPNATGLLVN